MVTGMVTHLIVLETCPPPAQVVLLLLVVEDHMVVVVGPLVIF